MAAGRDGPQDASRRRRPQGRLPDHPHLPGGYKGTAGGGVAEGGGEKLAALAAAAGSLRGRSRHDCLCAAAPAAAGRHHLRGPGGSPD